MDFNLSPQKMSDMKSDELKRKLIQYVAQGRDTFSEHAKQFFNQNNRSEASYYELNEAIIDTVDEILSAEPWGDSSLFLRNVVKPLKEIRDQALAMREHFSGIPTENLTLPALDANSCFVYVSLFQHAGNDIKQWQSQLNSIQSHLSGRPLYAKEDQAQHAIRQKLNQTSEAYAIIMMDQNFLRITEEARTDRYNIPLVSVAPQAITAESIVGFVHLGKRYRFLDGQLVAMPTE